MRWLVALCLVLVTGCHSCKGDPEKCKQMCQNYAHLDYWEGANAEIDKLPVEERDAARHAHMATFTQFLERGLDYCTSQCVAANAPDDMNCVIAAKTRAQAKACMTK
jgi:hypothetical protein